MFFADYHTHTAFSSDSTAKMEDMLDAAVKLGLQEIAITDHIDFYYPDLNYPFLFDYNEYAAKIRQYQEQYQGRLTIRLGVEIGLQDIAEKEIKEYCQNHAFDFIIGSTHCVSGKELYHDEFYEGKTQREAYQTYFEDLLHNVQIFDCFQVYGHMDYVNRYGSYDNRDLHYKDYADIIDEILKTLIAKGKGLEINTSGLRYGLGYAHPQLPVLKRYRELGGEIITIGSDAHSPNQITSYFTEAFALLQSAGFKAYTLFENQKPIWKNL